MSTWMSRKLGSMVRINGLFHLVINGIYWGYNLGGAFKYFLFSPLLGEDSHFD